jgi:hypothetical protein
MNNRRAAHLRRITKTPEADPFALCDGIARVLDGQSGNIAIQALALSLIRVIGQSPDPEAFWNHVSVAIGAAVPKAIEERSIQ